MLSLAKIINFGGGVKPCLSVAGSTLLVGFLGLTVSPSLAASIGVNFYGGPFTIPASGSPGIVSAINWNNIAGTSGTNITLNDDTATATTAQLTFTAPEVYNSFTAINTPNAATNTLYRSGLILNNGVAISLSGIPYSSYDLYVFASADTSATNQLSISNGTTTFYYASAGQHNSGATALLKTTSTTSGSPTTGPAQYQLFSGLTGSSVTLTAGGAITHVISNNLFGFQIVNTAQSVPESSMIMGLVFFGGGLFAVSRRKNRN
jgi:hypothetical protein